MLTGEIEPLGESKLVEVSVVLTDRTLKISFETHRLLVVILTFCLVQPPLKKTSPTFLADDNRRSETADLIPSDFNIDIFADRFMVAIFYYRAEEKEKENEKDS